jgi:hypothetical protein
MHASRARWARNPGKGSYEIVGRGEEHTMAPMNEHKLQDPFTFHSLPVPHPAIQFHLNPRMSHHQTTHPEMDPEAFNLDQPIELHPTNQRIEAERIRM